MAAIGAAVIAMLASVWLAFGHGPDGRPRGPSPRAAAVGMVANAPAELSLAQLAGQRVVYSYAGLRPPASLLGAIHAGEAGGVILFGPNIAAAQSRAVINELQRAALASPLPRRSSSSPTRKGARCAAFPGHLTCPRSRSEPARTPLRWRARPARLQDTTWRALGSTRTSPPCSTCFAGAGASSINFSARTRATRERSRRWARRSYPRSSRPAWRRPQSTSGPRRGGPDPEHRPVPRHPEHPAQHAALR